MAHYIVAAHFFGYISLSPIFSFICHWSILTVANHVFYPLPCSLRSLSNLSDTLYSINHFLLIEPLELILFRSVVILSRSWIIITINTRRGLSKYWSRVQKFYKLHSVIFSFATTQRQHYWWPSQVNFQQVNYTKQALSESSSIAFTWNSGFELEFFCIFQQKTVKNKDHLTLWHMLMAKVMVCWLWWKPIFLQTNTLQ